MPTTSSSCGLVSKSYYDCFVVLALRAYLDGFVAEDAIPYILNAYKAERKNIMKTAMFEAYKNAKNAAKAAAPTARGPIAARQLNVAHDPALLTDKNGAPYTVINGYDPKNTLYKVIAFGSLAEELVATITKGDFVEFTGRQQDIPAQYAATAKAKIMLNASDRSSFKVLSASQEKAQAKSERTAEAKAVSAFQAKLERIA